MKNIADFLFARRASSVQPEWIADILGRLVWLMDDNGTEIIEELARWISSGDLERIRIALAYDETYLYKTREEMVQAFSNLIDLYPSLRERCDEIVKEWDNKCIQTEKSGTGSSNKLRFNIFPDTK